VRAWAGGGARACSSLAHPRSCAGGDSPAWIRPREPRWKPCGNVGGYAAFRKRREFERRRRAELAQLARARAMLETMLKQTAPRRRASLRRANISLAREFWRLRISPVEHTLFKARAHQPSQSGRLPALRVREFGRRDHERTRCTGFTSTRTFPGFSDTRATRAARLPMSLRVILCTHDPSASARTADASADRALDSLRAMPT